MTDSIDIYSKYNVDVNRLTRDYLKFPLRKILTKSHQKEYEKIPKEDFEYLYIECNLPSKVFQQYFKVSQAYIRTLNKIYGVKKSYNKIIENCKKYYRENYGVENVFQTEECKEKSIQTSIEKFGVEHPIQSPIVQEKSKQTNLQRYGVEYYTQTDEYKERYKQTCLQNYGVEHVSQTEECKEKVRRTNLERHGVEFYMQTDEFREKSKQTCLEYYGVEHSGQSPIVREKAKQTNLKKYGVENPFQSEECKEKSKQTCIERYGVENYAQSDESKNRYKDGEYVNSIMQKQYETKKKNGSFGKSEEEEEIYNILLTKFNEVIRQYKSDLYPFPCDFYIPEKDLYIEYQGYFTHGKEPYLGTDEQNKIVESWKNENTEHYLNAVKTWTDRDPHKRTIAKQNNLNWIEFFNMNEFMKWIESI